MYFNDFLLATIKEKIIFVRFCFKGLNLIAKLKILSAWLAGKRVLVCPWRVGEVLIFDKIGFSASFNIAFLIFARRMMFVTNLVVWEDDVHNLWWTSRTVNRKWKLQRVLVAQRKWVLMDIYILVCREIEMTGLILLVLSWWRCLKGVLNTEASCSVE